MRAGGVDRGRVDTLRQASFSQVGWVDGRPGQYLLRSFGCGQVLRVSRGIFPLPSFCLGFEVELDPD